MRRSLLTAISGGVVLLSVTAIAFAAVSAGTWKTDIKGVGGTNITGHGTMKPTADGSGTEVDVMLMTDTPGVTRPWHVHIGSCAKSGGIFGGGRAYTPITIDAQGQGSSKATLAVATPDTGSYYVNIHQSSGSMGTIVACGDLVVEKP